MNWKALLIGLLVFVIVYDGVIYFINSSDGTLCTDTPCFIKDFVVKPLIIGIIAMGVQNFVTNKMRKSG